MRHVTLSLIVFSLIPISLFSLNALSAEEKRVELPAAAMQSVSEIEYTRKGADTCIKCHDQDSEFPVFDIFKTKHANIGDSRTPFSGLQCEACHGPGVKGIKFMEEALEAGSHVGRVKPGEKRPPIMNFGPKSNESVEAQNTMCLECHSDDKHIQWQGSPHQLGEVACADCHRVHTEHDPALTKSTQNQVCFNCHKKERADFFKYSNHPVRFGEMGCSDCHSSHSSNNSGSLVHATINDTCYSCHAEKRGPFIWEHAPAAEDCSLCHKPHGSSHPALLTKRAPMICRDCHSQDGHPSLSDTPDGLSNSNPSAMLLGNSCTNCHSQVHGSNHPSGVKMMR
ncbi:DmsE family decaheme c-type cytochrome [Teredinibacter sp. KSP-S5-2]|uniref:DmsE family decaheme c-type cytochrome n=1 Tax=Teredinibacter sp. KSP-S5-2 TaxID=3034506 RepID=UPI0029344B95|nr:DmsE family decaheme c-type cytochrome [Teredinibacter sp. KSP-S5-2]WNO11001.1 DmsE family decaheme c-type cytochrome [Teredinibacter sp. KSP-S5-2]